jgi:hypothetical protein
MGRCNDPIREKVSLGCKGAERRSKTGTTEKEGG